MSDSDSKSDSDDDFDNEENEEETVFMNKEDSDDSDDESIPNLIMRYDSSSDSDSDLDSDDKDEAIKEELALVDKLSGNLWIGGLGASCHLVNDDTYMYDVKVIKEKINIGNGVGIEATKVGNQG